MKNLRALIILGLLLLIGQVQQPARVSGAASPSNWPSLNFDAAQSNDNAAETGITAHNVLKLKIRWTAPIADASYPIVADGRVYVPIVAHGKIHVRALDATTGAQLAVYPKDALGGLLFLDGKLYLAGHVVQAVDPATGAKLLQINPSPKLKNGTFVYPVADEKVIAVGYTRTASTQTSTLYSIDPRSDTVLWKQPSASAQGAISGGRILTRVSTGGVFYDETSGKGLAKAPSIDSDWFAGPALDYTVASVKGKNATLYAFAGTGHIIWRHVVGPPIVAAGWPHAIGGGRLYVQALKPRSEVQALDPQSGSIRWARPVANVQRLVLAGGVLFVLTYGLGEPVRILALHARTGKAIGAIVLSTGYYAFGALNGLIVADGMVFLRVAGSTGSEIVALGLPSPLSRAAAA